MVAVRRNLGQARARARRRVLLLHQQPARAPPRRHRHLPRHRSGRRALCDHRAGHDFAHHRGQAGRAARFLEEAAGVSKYRERRRETELRIDDTRENLLEQSREAHYAASDALHEAQGGIYAANAEVSRLEQNLQHQRESRQRLAAQSTALADQG